jgi:hypothetical protein
MTIRLTASSLRKIIREEVTKVTRAKKLKLKEAPDHGMGDILDAVKAIHEGDHDEACEILAYLFDGSPTAAMDISLALQDEGIDEDTAEEIGDAVQMKYMD